MIYSDYILSKNHDLFQNRILRNQFKMAASVMELKGIVHNFFVYRSNLIFWIVMGCHGTLTQIYGAASENENPKMLSFGRL